MTHLIAPPPPAALHQCHTCSHVKPDVTVTAGAIVAGGSEIVVMEPVMEILYFMKKDVN